LLPIRFTRILTTLYSLLLASMLFLPELSTAFDAHREGEMVLEYRYRFNCQNHVPDHLLGVIAVSGNRLVISGNQGLALVDHSLLTPAGTDIALSRLLGLNAREVYLYQQNYLFVNLNGTGVNPEAGFAVVRIDGDNLTPVTIVSSTAVFFEKMAIAGNYLYVAAHSGGFHVYSISNPEAPYFRASIPTGFVNAYAVAVAGDTAYVADGGGGLKVVDISNPLSPLLVGGETLATAVGTAEDVTCRNGKVFLAAGASGVAVFDGADLASRRLIEVGGAARSFSWVGDHLAVSTIHGIAILGEVGGEYQLVASEITGRRGHNARLRLCGAIGTAGDSLVLCADWNCMDVYELMEFNTGSQPDISCDRQRIRFHPDGESVTATVWNNGAGDLHITAVNVNPPSFSSDFTPVTLQPGESLGFQISYNGSAQQDSGLVRIMSDDPDESPFPIQIFGETGYLNPGDQALDFTLPLYTRDHGTGTYSWEPFTLSEQLGKVIWFQAYGSW